MTVNLTHVVEALIELDTQGDGIIRIVNDKGQGYLLRRTLALLQAHYPDINPADYLEVFNAQQGGIGERLGMRELPPFQQDGDLNIYSTADLMEFQNNRRVAEGTRILWNGNGADPARVVEANANGIFIIARDQAHTGLTNID